MLSILGCHCLLLVPSHIILSGIIDMGGQTQQGTSEGIEATSSRFDGPFISNGVFAAILSAAQVYSVEAASDILAQSRL
jgi:hypothetical protein